MEREVNREWMRKLRFISDELKTTEIDHDYHELCDRVRSVIHSTSMLKKNMIKDDSVLRSIISKIMLGESFRIESGEMYDLDSASEFIRSTILFGGISIIGGRKGAKETKQEKIFNQKTESMVTSLSQLSDSERKNILDDIINLTFIPKNPMLSKKINHYKDRFQLVSDIVNMPNTDDDTDDETKKTTDVDEMDMKQIMRMEMENPEKRMKITEVKRDLNQHDKYMAQSTENDNDGMQKGDTIVDAFIGNGTTMSQLATTYATDYKRIANYVYTKESNTNLPWAQIMEIALYNNNGNVFAQKMRRVLDNDSKYIRPSVYKIATQPKINIDELFEVLKYLTNQTELVQLKNLVTQWSTEFYENLYEGCADNIKITIKNVQRENQDGVKLVLHSEYNDDRDGLMAITTNLINSGTFASVMSRGADGIYMVMKSTMNGQKFRKRAVITVETDIPLTDGVLIKSERTTINMKKYGMMDAVYIAYDGSTKPMYAGDVENTKIATALFNGMECDVKYNRKRAAFYFQRGILDDQNVRNNIVERAVALFASDKAIIIDTSKMVVTKLMKNINEKACEVVKDVIQAAEIMVQETAKPRAERIHTNALKQDDKALYANALRTATVIKKQRDDEKQLNANNTSNDSTKDLCGKGQKSGIIIPDPITILPKKVANDIYTTVLNDQMMQMNKTINDMKNRILFLENENILLKATLDSNTNDIASLKATIMRQNQESMSMQQTIQMSVQTMKNMEDRIIDADNYNTVLQQKLAKFNKNENEMITMQGERSNTFKDEFKKVAYEMVSNSDELTLIVTRMMLNSK